MVCTASTLLRRACVGGLGALAVAATVVIGPLPQPATAATTKAAAASPAGPAGYWLVGADGSIYNFGGAAYLGSAQPLHLPDHVVAMTPTPDGRGYWLASATGGLYSFGDAGFAGSVSGLPSSARPNSPVIAVLATPSGDGYWMFTATGGVYAFGNAPFEGSLGGKVLSSPIVGVAATPDGGGYWMASADGSVFSFGDAQFYGSAYPYHPVQPVVGMAIDPTGGGYWLVARDGGIFSFGAAGFHGSTGAMTLNQPIVGMAPTPSGQGYWLVAADGGIFTFGDAPFRGSTGGQAIGAPIVGMAATLALDPYVPGSSGYDISFPQCGGSYPSPPGAFAVVGVNDGRAFTDNPCLASEAAWAGRQLSLYINLNAPPAGSTQGRSGPAGTCVGNNTGCIAYNYGYNAALHAFGDASAAGVSASIWWLDIETGNTWDTSTYNNDETIQGALDALGAEGILPGIYSTGYQWSQIAGTFAPQRPIWVATGSTIDTATAYCAPSHGFGGGTIWLTQYGATGVAYDEDYACPLP